MQHGRAALAMRGYPTPARTRSDALAAVECDFIAERASALGRIGSRLEAAIEAWERLRAAGEVDDPRVRAALHDVVEAAWALLVQRECAGFRVGNLRWIGRAYRVPDEALRRL